MKTRYLISFAAVSTALLLAGCEKEKTTNTGATPAIKVIVGNVETKAKVITDHVGHPDRTSGFYDFIETSGFKMSAYVTAPWRRDVIGQSPEILAGIYVDPGEYSGPYDESTYPSGGNKLEDVLVTYDSTRDHEAWRITGNDNADYAGHKFSWVNNIQMNFFAYAPVTPKGTRVLPSSTNGTPVASPFTEYVFNYTAKATGGAVVSGDCDDLIFAFNSHTAHFESDNSKPGYGSLVSGSSDTLKLNFHHALAQIRFCVSTDDDTYDPSIKLVSVKLKGVKDPATGAYSGISSSGSCTFNGTPTNNAARFAWSSLAEPVEYSQTFNALFADGTGAAVTPSGWILGSYGTAPNLKNLYTCTGDVLFILPQTLGDCKIEVTFQQGSDPAFTLEGSLPATDNSSTNVYWEAGKYYTYKIKASKGLGVDLLPPGWIDGGGSIKF